MNFEHLKDVKPLQIFDVQVISFLDKLSKKILRSNEGFSDVSTFAFWCRKASIEKMKRGYKGGNLNTSKSDENMTRLGKGILFHIAPSNVPVNFAYSLVVGLLSGNINIIRLSSKEFLQVNIIVDSINELVECEYKDLAPYINLVKYQHEKEITDYLSELCDVRIIWGGDNTIKEIRKSPLKARSTEVTFADRYSILLVNADEYLKREEKENIAQNFYNDTYLFDQNACTSPKAVVWLGGNVSNAREIFWNNLEKLVKEKYEISPIQAVDKLYNFYKIASDSNNIKLVSKDNYITRVEVDVLEADIYKCFYNSGYFIEYTAKEIEEILPLCGDKCQTLSYLGIESSVIKEFLLKERPRGIDRVCSLGEVHDFDLIWDGYDLIFSLSRVINI